MCIRDRHSHHGVMLFAEALQLLHVAHGHAAQLPAYHFGFFVKRADKPVALGLHSEVTGDSRTKAPGADENGVQLCFAEQQVAHSLEQNVHMVTDALLAEAAEAVEILPHLRGGGAHHVGKLGGRHLHHAVLFHICQIPVIFRQPLDDGKRHLAIL